MPTRILVEISGHGFGHLMQMMPVAAALQERFPDFEISIRSGIAPERFMQEVARFGRFRTLGDAAPDFHPRMKDAFSVDAAATIDACRGVFDDLDSLVAAQQRFLRDEGFDLVIADISPLPLAAAQRSGLPSIALCSLDWASTLAFIPALRTPLAGVVEGLRAIYRQCDLFLRPAPHIGCANLPNCHPIGHVARVGRNVRREIDAALGLDPATRLVMLSSGGMDGFPFPIDIPPVDGLFWIVPDALRAAGPDRAPLSAFRAWAYPDLVASLDTLVGKPGYGLIVEAVTSGVPFASHRRTDWVDVGSIETWGEAKGVLRRLSANEIRSGAWIAEVARLARGPRAQPLAPSGAEEAVALIASIL